jgi:methyl-accepting chemotaxis protein
MSLRFRLILAFSLMSIVVITLLGTALGYALHVDARSSFEESAKENLIAKREQKSGLIKGLISNVGKQLVLQSQSDWAQQAVKDFKIGFKQLQLLSSNFTPINNKLSAYYSDSFGKEYLRQNGLQADTRSLLNGLSPVAKVLQQAYIADNPEPLGGKHEFNLGNTQSKYDDIHQRYHEEFKRFLESWSYYDIFIVEPETGHIIYSVFKELDFGTSLKSGPYSNSGIATAFNEGLDLKSGETFLTDFNQYPPSYENPASFVSTPVFINGEIEAVLIYQIPIGRINEIMINEKKWVEKGYGQSGESYLVGNDSTMLTESRFFLEDQLGYIKLLKQLGQDNIATTISAKGSSIGIQPVDTKSAERALNGEKGFLEVLDYRDVAVFSAFSSIDVGNGITWALLSEVDVEEALKWASIMESHQVTSTLVVAVISIIVSIIMAFFYSNQLSNPMNQLAQKFSDISNGEGDLTQRVSKQNLEELDQIGMGFNDFLEQVEAIVEQVKSSSINLSILSDTLEQSSKKSSSNTMNQKDSTLMVTTAMEEYSASFNEVADSTKSATLDAKKAADASNVCANESRQASGKINHLVEKLSDSSESVEKLELQVGNIKDILSTITSIADQTNLLALNAAIEAARAGEQGRGFAVVADEVRTLAGRTQKTTVEIQSKMDELQKAAQFTSKNIIDSSKQANEGAKIVANVASKLDELSIKVKAVENRNMGIAGSTVQQLATANEINMQLENINNFSTDLSTTAKQVAYTVEQINAISLGINVLMERFKVNDTVPVTLNRS